MLGRFYLTSLISIWSWAIFICLMLAGATLSGQTKRDEDLGVRFTNVAQQVGLNVSMTYGDEHRNRYLLETTGSGAAFIDYDNDGWLDVFLVNGTRLDGLPPNLNSTNRLFRNTGNGRFTDVTEKAGLIRTGWGQSVCAGDYDNDGYIDLFISSYGKNALYHNNRHGTFTELACLVTSLCEARTRLDGAESTAIDRPRSRNQDTDRKPSITLVRTSALAGVSRSGAVVCSRNLKLLNPELEFMGEAKPKAMIHQFV